MQFWKKALIGLAAAACIATAGTGVAAQSDDSRPAPAVTQQGPATAIKSGYAPVNGLEMYYEVHGQGEPLVLIHGALGNIDGQWPAILPGLAKERQVIVMDLQAHGRTADIDRPFSAEQFADDIDALMQHLGVAKADIMGYSMGGATGLQLAIRHPERVRKLVIMSAAHDKKGWYPEVQSTLNSMNGSMAALFMETPIYRSYVAVAPNKEGFPALLDKLGAFTARDYDWSQDVAKIAAPALIIAADAASVSIDHVV
jgi:pimeloyl-ACP methyl ester carboxylesterase